MVDALLGGWQVVIYDDGTQTRTSSTSATSPRRSPSPVTTTG
ncbi:hypothetical protein NKG94_07285 [Micromonospora sp. M12]